MYSLLLGGRPSFRRRADIWFVTTAKDVDFTKVAASKAAFTVDELELLTALPDVMQEEKISYKARTNDVTVQIETAFNNTKLTVGYLQMIWAGSYPLTA